MVRGVVRGKDKRVQCDKAPLHGVRVFLALKDGVVLVGQGCCPPSVLFYGLRRCIHHLAYTLTLTHSHSHTYTFTLSLPHSILSLPYQIDLLQLHCCSAAFQSNRNHPPRLTSYHIPNCSVSLSLSSAAREHQPPPHASVELSVRQNHPPAHSIHKNTTPADPLAEVSRQH
ncbi:hypothetical protein E6O75_ATG00190 [Venturia nashicola]|uniref:Uncharacterized protein n=1 Tax=Venturia nashicola TaxID=86259 RepID=A0A4Z1PEP7_9PEZI|nr:hypothetical protein E6O75_ATG00190 [Venturia nashicola]